MHASNIMYCLHSLLTIKTISPSFFLWPIMFTFSLHVVGSFISVYVNPIRMAVCSSCMHSNIMYCLHTLLTLTTISPSFFFWLIMFTFSLHVVGSSISVYVNPIRMALCSSCMCSNIMYCLHTLLTLTTISLSFFLWLIVFTLSLHAVGSSIRLYVMSTQFEWHCAHYACTQILCIAFTHSSQSKQSQLHSSCGWSCSLSLSMRLVHLLGCRSTPFEWHCAHHACAQILCIAFTHSSHSQQFHLLSSCGWSCSLSLSMRLVHLLVCMGTPFEWVCAPHACAQILCIAFTHSSHSQQSHPLSSCGWSCSLSVSMRWFIY